MAGILKTSESGPVLWNPLVCRGTSMAGNALLVAKFCAIILATGGVHRAFEAPLLPWAVFSTDAAGSAAFGLVLGVAFAVSALALLLNQYVRAASAVAGVCAMLGLIGSLSAFAGHLALAAVALILGSLHAEKARPRLVRGFVVTALGVTAVTGATDLDWISGTILQLWRQAELVHPILDWVAGWVPWLPWAPAVAWIAVAGPLLLAVGLSLPNRSRILIWSGTVLCVLTSLFADSSETTAFLIATFACVIAFLDWPREHLRAIWPRACGLPMWLRIALDKHDWDHRVEWPMPADPDGILEVEIDDRHFHGARALTTLLLYSPAFLMVVFVTIWILHLALPSSVATLMQTFVAAPLLAVFIRPRYLQMRQRLKQTIENAGS